MLPLSSSVSGLDQTAGRFNSHGLSTVRTSPLTKGPFGNGQYSNNVIDQFGNIVPGNSLTITVPSTVAPDPITGAAVVSCNSLTLNGQTASLTPTRNCKGLFVIAKTFINLLKGNININYLGKAGNFGNTPVTSLIPANILNTIKLSSLSSIIVLGEGAAGGAAQYNDSSGNNGTAAGAMQTGGGGSGSQNSLRGGTNSGKGGKGGPCCGGAGSGADDGGASANAGDYGGPGSAGVPGNPASDGGGAGDPVGAGNYIGGGGAAQPSPAQGAGGGLLFLLAPSINISSGCTVSANGAMGGAGWNGGNSIGGGGSAGGGCIVIATSFGGLINNGTIQAAGGPLSMYNGVDGLDGGAGGAGSVNIFTVS